MSIFPKLKNILYKYPCLQQLESVQDEHGDFITQKHFDTSGPLCGESTRSLMDSPHTGSILWPFSRCLLLVPFHFCVKLSFNVSQINTLLIIKYRDYVILLLQSEAVVFRSGSCGCHPLIAMLLWSWLLQIRPIQGINGINLIRKLVVSLKNLAIGQCLVWAYPHFVTGEAINSLVYDLILWWT